RVLVAGGGRRGALGPRLSPAVSGLRLPPPTATRSAPRPGHGRCTVEPDPIDPGSGSSRRAAAPRYRGGLPAGLYDPERTRPRGHGRGLPRLATQPGADGGPEGYQIRRLGFRPGTISRGGDRRRPAPTPQHRPSLRRRVFRWPAVSGDGVPAR